MTISRFHFLLTICKCSSRLVHFTIAFTCCGLGVLFPPPIKANKISATPVAANAIRYLAGVMDEFQTNFWVYSDNDAAGNHFVVLARMSYLDGKNKTVEDRMLPAMKFHQSGALDQPDYIEATFVSQCSTSWGGWYFMNGILTESNRVVTPIPNWGDYPRAGLNLSGATKISFWARGKTGGERVQFFLCGVGRDSDTGHALTKFHDSSEKISLGKITLSPEWKYYENNLDGKNLKYVLGGFGWVAKADENSNQPVTFYLKNISYELNSNEQRKRVTTPHFLTSYKFEFPTSDSDRALENTAYTYDNALVLIALLSVGDVARAKVIADAFLEAQANDRFYTDGSLRNAYQGGDLLTSPGWIANGHTRSARLPGFMGGTNAEPVWLEDQYADSRDTGNMAWAMLGLLAYHEIACRDEGTSPYLAAAKRLGDWVATNCVNPGDTNGFAGGYFGWQGAETKRKYKATEHNIDLYAAFARLGKITREEKWQQRAECARRFVISMWDTNEHKFWTGTDTNGIEINSNAVPLDIQAWALLSLREEASNYCESLDYAQTNISFGEGYDFSKKPPTSANGNAEIPENGVWYEGTAHMTVAWELTGQFTKDPVLAKDRAVRLLRFLEENQNQDDGSMLAASTKIWTGYNLPDDSGKWYYFPRKHIGATAWLVFAEMGTNPYWFGGQ